MVEDNLSPKLAKLEEALIRRATEGMTLSTSIMRDTAKTNHRYKDITGTLTQSIRIIEPEFDGQFVTGGVEATAAHAVFVHEGTKPHIIKAKNAKALAFEPSANNTVIVKSVNHPGTQPDPFMTNAVHTHLSDHNRIMTEATELAINEAIG